MYLVRFEYLKVDDAVHHTPSRKRRPHVILKKMKLSPHCASLYCEFTKSRKQLIFDLRAKSAFSQKIIYKAYRENEPYCKDIFVDAD
ncbi:unnamed protein product [Leptidea sinapis]|uniref:Uncharacterized protein n=1 Tax=Leptidea sinapis TaxID=189913 RepID=A0A5E4QSQ6_9NEOP|nr:unnamed protein product [Leptidea sinapis]